MIPTATILSGLRDTEGSDHGLDGTAITRPKYRRERLRYASDTTDEESALIEPHLPPPASRGRTRETDLRDAGVVIY